MNCTPQVHAHAGRTGEPKPPVVPLRTSTSNPAASVTAAVRPEENRGAIQSLFSFDLSLQED